MKKNALLPLSLIFASLFTGCQLLYPPGVYEDVVQGQGRGHIYVSVNKGDDNNSGTSMDKPVKSLQKGLDIAGKDRNVIYVTASTYSPGNGLSTNNYGANIYKSDIKLFGGFDENFTNRTGRTILDGKNGLPRVLSAVNVNHLIIDGFNIQNGFTPVDSGGGVFLSNVSDVSFANCGIYSNRADNGNGGGISVINSSNVTLKADVFSNVCLGIGGGIYISGSYNCTVSGSVCSNIAGAAGGSGGGIAVISSQITLISALVSYNQNTPGMGGVGGGIYISGCISNMITSAVFSNSSDTGGGVYIANSRFNSFNGDISSNSSAADGGGIYLSSVTNTGIDGKVDFNASGPVNNGGGLCFSGTVSQIIINAEVTGNLANQNGGGIYSDAAFDFMSISGNISGNTASGDGGGIYISAANAPNNLSINNAAITMNYSGGTTASVIYITPNTYLYSAITFSGCTIGGTSTSMNGIYYDAAGNLSSLTIINNSFLGSYLDTSKLFYFNPSFHPIGDLNGAFSFIAGQTLYGNQVAF